MSLYCSVYITYTGTLYPLIFVISCSELQEHEQNKNGEKLKENNAKGLSGEGDENCYFCFFNALRSLSRFALLANVVEFVRVEFVQANGCFGLK